VKKSSLLAPLAAHSSMKPYLREARMLGALFWYTGLVVWILIVFGAVSTILIDAHDRSVLKR
jgi:hypothetical protein